MDELADPLSAPQLQLGPLMGKQDAPKLALAKEVVKLGHRDISYARVTGGRRDLAVVNARSTATRSPSRDAGIAHRRQGTADDSLGG